MAWPALRYGFGEPLGSLGELLAPSLCGYLAIGSTAGWTLRQFGAAVVLCGSAVTGCMGADLFAVTHWWALLVASALLLGAAGGLLDAALNTVMALDGRASLMNLLHAAYEVGAGTWRAIGDRRPTGSRGCPRRRLGHLAWHVPPTASHRRSR